MTNHEVKYHEFKQKVTNLKKVDEISNLSSENRKKSDFDLASYKLLNVEFGFWTEKKSRKKKQETRTS